MCVHMAPGGAGPGFLLSIHSELVVPMSAPPVEALLASASETDAHVAAEQLCDAINERSLRWLADERILEALIAATRDKKSALSLIHI